jgi:hypothetical protein
LPQDQGRIVPNQSGGRAGQSVCRVAQGLALSLKAKYFKGKPQFDVEELKG